MTREIETFHRLKYDGDWYLSALACVKDMQRLVEEGTVTKFHISQKLSDEGLAEVWINTSKPIYIRNVKLDALTDGRFHCLAVCPNDMNRVASQDREFWSNFRY